jgi:hypothetical protein
LRRTGAHVVNRQSHHRRRLQRRLFERIQIARAGQRHVPLVHGRESGNTRRELTPAASGQRCQRHPVEETSHGRFRRIEIAVGVEPENARASLQARHTAKRRRTAVPRQNQGERPGLDRRAHGDGDAARELECRADLGRPRAMRHLDDSNVHVMTRSGQSPLEPGVEQAPRTRAHALAAPAGVIRNGDQLHAHSWSAVSTPG